MNQDQPQRTRTEEVPRLFLGRRTRDHALPRRPLGASPGDRRRGPEHRHDEGGGGPRRARVHRRGIRTDGGRGREELRPLPGHAAAAHRQLGAVSPVFQPRRPRDDVRPLRAGDAPGCGARGVAPRGPRGGRVLADDPPGPPGRDPAGQLRRADRYVPGPARTVEPRPQLRREPDRGPGAPAGAGGGRGDRRRQLPRPAPRHPLGRQGHHRGARLPDHLGRRRLREPGHRHGRRRRRTPRRGGRGAGRQAHHRANWRSATTGSAGAPTTRGIRRRAPADRPPARGRRPAAGSWGSRSGPTPAGPSSRPRSAAASSASARPSGGSPAPG